MEKILNDILDSIKLNENDIHWFGNSPINRIKDREFLQNPNNNFEILKEYLIDEINFNKIKIAHSRKYSPEIYHENVALSREYEIEVSEQILKMLDEV